MSQLNSFDNTLRILANSTDGALDKGSLSASGDEESSSNGMAKGDSIYQPQIAKTCKDAGLKIIFGKRKL